MCLNKIKNIYIKSKAEKMKGIVLEKVMIINCEFQVLEHFSLSTEWPHERGVNWARGKDTIDFIEPAIKKTTLLDL
jgi:hypothetical protein